MAISTKAICNAIVGTGFAVHGFITTRALCSKKTKLTMADSIITGIGVGIAGNSIVRKAELVQVEATRCAIIGEAAGALLGAVTAKLENVKKPDIPNIKVKIDVEKEDESSEK